MAVEGDELGKSLFDPFSAAESACEEAVESILTEGGRLLFESYIERKSFPFASEAISEVLVAELRMCFVRCDAGEPLFTPAACSRPLPSSPPSPSPSGLDDSEPPSAPPPNPVARTGWALEPEPARCRIDTWARACVPVRRRPKAVPVVEDDRKRSRGTNASKYSTASTARSPSRAGGAASSDHAQGRAAAPSKPILIPLTEEREEDEEEAGLREMKEREAKRKREEEARIQRKAAEEAEEAARHAQVKEQMKNKPFTYDSNGNIIWVQPLKTNKMPSTNPAPTYSFKKDVQSSESSASASAKPPARGAPKGVRRPSPKKKQEGGFTDSFKKFPAQQPSALETMTMAPGVELSERGHRKRGVEVPRPPGQPMSRKEYEDMVHANTGYSSSAPFVDPRAPAPAAASQAPPAPSGGSVASAVLTPRGSAMGGAGKDEGQGLKAVRKPDSGAQMVPHPPASPRPVQPAAPPTFRRAQMKRDALGFALSTRERVPTGTASRYPNCAAQPPLGATMGHGLVPGGQKQEEFYFPHAAPNAAASIEDEDEASVSMGIARSQGQIVSRNPELTKRLFPR